MFWIGVLGLSIYFLLDKVLNGLILNYFNLFNHINENQKPKIAVYFLEAISITFQLYLSFFKNSLSIIWNPSAFEHLTPTEVGMHINIIGVMFTVTMFIQEKS